MGESSTIFRPQVGENNPFEVKSEVFMLMFMLMCSLAVPFATPYQPATIQMYVGRMALCWDILRGMARCCETHM